IISWFLNKLGDINMKLSMYKKLFENEFELNIKPSKNLYSYIRNIKNVYTFPLDRSKFYFQNPPISIKEENDQLDVFVEPNTIKTLYLSYLTLDNKFAEIPAESFINIESLEHFYIDINIATSSDVEVIPFIIHYNNKGKKKMTRITNRNQLITILEDETKIRLTFKVKGNGNFKIKRITRIE